MVAGPDFAVRLLRQCLEHPERLSLAFRTLLVFLDLQNDGLCGVGVQETVNPAEQLLERQLLVIAILTNAAAVDDSHFAFAVQARAHVLDVVGAIALRDELPFLIIRIAFAGDVDDLTVFIVRFIVFRALHVENAIAARLRFCIRVMLVEILVPSLSDYLYIGTKPSNAIIRIVRQRKDRA